MSSFMLASCPSIPLSTRRLQRFCLTCLSWISWAACLASLMALSRFFRSKKIALLNVTERVVDHEFNTAFYHFPSSLLTIPAEERIIFDSLLSNHRGRFGENARHKQHIHAGLVIAYKHSGWVSVQVLFTFDGYGDAEQKACDVIVQSCDGPVDQMGLAKQGKRKRRENTVHCNNSKKNGWHYRTVIETTTHTVQCRESYRKDSPCSPMHTGECRTLTRTRNKILSGQIAGHFGLPFSLTQVIHSVVSHPVE